MGSGEELLTESKANTNEVGEVNVLAEQKVDQWRRGMRDRGDLDDFADVKNSQSMLILKACGRNFEFHCKVLWF